ncbi:hypothetical protein [Corynebacterium gerontici]|uniref:hypothetical protein n=1 Tax=Corynebacterium gerontici TaxID=2079234 RepID=UPI0013DDD8CC|nr:hypothetical protein [Corynebacterium gerontici]
MLLELLRPTSGRVEVLGRDPRREGVAIRRQVGYLPGEIHLDPRQNAQTLFKAWGGTESDRRQ